MKKKPLIGGASVLILLLMVLLLYYLPKWQTRAYNQTSFVMGTVFSISLEGKEDPTVELVNLGNSLERDLLSRRIETSEIARINASAGNPKGYPLSQEMEELLGTCLDISEKSGGAFDITLGTVIELWDIDGWASGERGDVEAFTPPGTDEIAKAMENCGYQKVRIADHRIYLPEGMILDLGAVGKGLYLDKCREMAKEDVRGIVSAGGSILTVGDKADGSDWKVGITNPFGEELYGTAFTKGYKCVSTSGNYERFVEYDGVRYHHILDPATGYPAWVGFDSNNELPDSSGTGIASVTIVSESGLLSDALSTACYVLGEDKGMELANTYDADILIICNDGSHVTNSSAFKFQ